MSGVARDIKEGMVGMEKGMRGMDGREREQFDGHDKNTCYLGRSIQLLDIDLGLGNSGGWYVTYGI